MAAWPSGEREKSVSLSEVLMSNRDDQVGQHLLDGCPSVVIQ